MEPRQNKTVEGPGGLKNSANTNALANDPRENGEIAWPGEKNVGILEVFEGTETEGANHEIGEQHKQRGGGQICGCKVTLDEKLLEGLGTLKKRKPQRDQSYGGGPWGRF